MFYSLIILIYYIHHLLLHTISASSTLFTLNDVRYTLSDRILTIPKLASIRGIHIDYENKYYEKYNLVHVEAYLGIQYGLYNGRFEPSKEKFSLHQTTEVKKQIEYGPACSQYIWTNTSKFYRIRTKQFIDEYYPRLLKFISKQNEDQCLYMNIYQPQIKNLKERLPVLVFVHGDGYDMGTGAAFDGAIFASYTKTIVVTINYRLGPFGFLYVSNENKGDYALQDIYTALHWLKNYVKYFNGDSDRITLYGTGSGAVLASLTVMLETVNGGTGTIKRRKSLVHRLILNDQTFLSPYMTSTVQDLSPYYSNIFANLSCSTIFCLRNKTLITTDNLLELNTYSNEYEHINYMCPLENPFPFYHLTSSTNINNQTNHLRLQFHEKSYTLLPENLPIILTTSSSSLSLQYHTNNINIDYLNEYLINYAYTKWNKTSNEFYFDQQLFIYHQQILAPLLEYAKDVSTKQNVYMIERNSKTFQSELPYTFGYVLAPSISVYNHTYLYANDYDRNESIHMMNLFANLIHTGNINTKSPYYKEILFQSNELFRPIFPEFNSIILKDGNLVQQSGHYVQVHYLFNNLLSNRSNQSLNIDTFNRWKTMYDVSYQNNYSYQHSHSLRSSLFIKAINSQIKNPKYIFILTLCVLCLFIINFFICIIVTRRGYGCRKRQYNCLHTHKPLNIDSIQQHGSSSPSSTNSNGTITQHLIVNNLNSTLPIHFSSSNRNKTNELLRNSLINSSALLPEANV